MLTLMVQIPGNELLNEKLSPTLCIIVYDISWSFSRVMHIYTIISQLYIADLCPRMSHNLAKSPAKIKNVYLCNFFYLLVKDFY